MSWDLVLSAAALLLAFAGGFAYDRMRKEAAMSLNDEERRRRAAKRRGDNEPLEVKQAAWDGHRSVRLIMPQGSVGLATATYSYQLEPKERADVARRMAAAWNYCRGLTTEQIEAGRT